MARTADEKRRIVRDRFREALLEATPHCLRLRADHCATVLDLVKYNMPELALPPALQVRLACLEMLSLALQALTSRHANPGPAGALLYNRLEALQRLRPGPPTPLTPSCPPRRPKWKACCTWPWRWPRRPRSTTPSERRSRRPRSSLPCPSCTTRASRCVGRPGIAPLPCTYSFPGTPTPASEPSGALAGLELRRVRGGSLTSRHTILSPSGGLQVRLPGRPDDASSPGAPTLSDPCQRSLI